MKTLESTSPPTSLLHVRNAASKGLLSIMPRKITVFFLEVFFLLGFFTWTRTHARTQHAPHRTAPQRRRTQGGKADSSASKFALRVHVVVRRVASSSSMQQLQADRCFCRHIHIGQCCCVQVCQYVCACVSLCLSVCVRARAL
eukprot:INCI5899.2.p2 GENE.INCI5899.2~~INCI5899.2.p2  ORF type:complete len:143 (+),score=21.46 INCI5899.2:134-562(+)